MMISERKKESREVTDAERCRREDNWGQIYVTLGCQKNAYLIGSEINATTILVPFNRPYICVCVWTSLCDFALTVFAVLSIQQYELYYISLSQMSIACACVHYTFVC